MKVAVIFHRLGPYHVARLAAAGRQMDLTAVELASQTSEYAWDPVDSGASFQRFTLFPDGDSRAAGSPEVRQRLHAALAAAKPSVVVVPGWSDAGALAALEWSIRNNVPAIVMSESTAWDEPRVAWKEWTKRRLVGLCSAGLAGGTPHAEYLIQLGLPRENISLGYDAVDNNYFAANAAAARANPSAVRRQHGLPENYFLASARFIEKKNLPRLFEAYARYRQIASASHSETLPAAPWDLVLLGDGPLRPQIERLISDLRLPSSVHLPGFKQYPDLPAYYACARVFIHASTSEQWGLVVNEAMACGLPVLVSNRCGCARDLAQPGVNGFTFDPLSVEQLASFMVKISAFNFPLSAFGAASHRLIANWGPERFASGLQSAAECALRVGPVKSTLPQRIILKALLSR